MPGENRISELLNEKRYLKEIGEDFSHIDAEIFQITGRVLEADGGRIGYAGAGVVSGLANVAKPMASNKLRDSAMGLGALGAVYKLAKASPAGAMMTLFEPTEAKAREVVLDKIGYEYMDKMDDKMIEGEEGEMYSINDLLEFGYTPEEIQEFI